MLLTKEAKVGEVVRNKKNREIWLVVGKNNQGLLVINLMLKNNPASVMMILPAHADAWQRDHDIEDLEEWEKKTLEEKMPLIEEVEQAEENLEDALVVEIRAVDERIPVES